MRRSPLFVISHFFLDGICTLISHLPASWHERLATFLLWLFAPFLRKEYAKIADNVHHIHKLSNNNAFSTMFQRQVLRHQVISGLETFRAFYHPAEIEFEGMDEYRHTVKELLAKEKGLIVITGHLGSWELVAYATAMASGDLFTALAKPAKVRAITQIMDNNRARFYTKVLWTDQKMLFKTMISTLKNKKSLGFVMDQRSESRQGHRVQFLGHAADFVVGPAKTAMVSGAPVIAAFCMRTGSMRYRIVSEPLYEADHTENNEVLMTQRFADAIGGMIKLYPEQWVWNYRRWRFKREPSLHVGGDQ